MSDLPYGFAAVAVLLAALAILVIHANRSFYFRLAGLVVALVAIAASYAGLSDLLSRPKPAAWEWTFSDVEEFDVAYADVNPGRSIHLLLRVPGINEPRLYALPWHPMLAAQLEQAMATAEEEQVPVRTGPELFEIDLEDRERLFYASPMAALPAKGRERFEPAPFVPSDSTTMYGAGDDETGESENE